MRYFLSQRMTSGSIDRFQRPPDETYGLVRNGELQSEYLPMMTITSGGIMSIYNETPIRAGRRFWHFGKSFETVKAENGTYAERSTYLAAYRGDEMVGYLKIVWDVDTAAIMQILSKMSFRDCKPNNALLSEAVRQCCLRSVSYLLYEAFDYGNKIGDSLTRFKQNNGFLRVNVPRYYVPLTNMGALALRFGFHKRPAQRVPEWIAAPVRDLRSKWHERHARRSSDGAR